MLSADRLRLQQVFDNIFANSYKYADTEIQVNISTEERSLVISVEDYGGGVDEAELLFLKEKFRRGSNTRNIEGAGLGLYIADYCMRKMKGRIDNERNGVFGAAQCPDCDGVELQFLGLTLLTALIGTGFSYFLFPFVNAMMISQTGIPYDIRFLPLPFLMSLFFRRCSWHCRVACRPQD